MVFKARLKTSEDMINEKVKIDESKFVYNAAAHFWNYLLAYKDIRIKGIKTGMVYPAAIVYKQSAYLFFDKLFVNELEYPCDVLMEFSDLSAAFWDPQKIKHKRVIISYEEIKRKGFLILSCPTRFRTFKSQKVTYRIWQKGKPFPFGGVICPSLPSGHVIKLDQLYQKIRLEGPNAVFNTGVGFWHRFRTIDERKKDSF